MTDLDDRCSGPSTAITSTSGSTSTTVVTNRSVSSRAKSGPKARSSARARKSASRRSSFSEVVQSREIPSPSFDRRSQLGEVDEGMLGPETDDRGMGEMIQEGVITPDLKALDVRRIGAEADAEGENGTNGGIDAVERIGPGDIEDQHGVNGQDSGADYGVQLKGTDTIGLDISPSGQNRTDCHSMHRLHLGLDCDPSCAHVPKATAQRPHIVYKDDLPDPTAEASGSLREAEESDVIDTVLIVDSRLAPIDVNISNQSVDREEVRSDGIDKSRSVSGARKAEDQAVLPLVVSQLSDRS